MSHLQTARALITPFSEYMATSLARTAPASVPVRGLPPSPFCNTHAKIEGVKTILRMSWQGVDAWHAEAHMVPRLLCRASVSTQGNAGHAPSGSNISIKPRLQSARSAMAPCLCVQCHGVDVCCAVCARTTCMRLVLHSKFRPLVGTEAYSTTCIAAGMGR